MKRDEELAADIKRRLPQVKADAREIGIPYREGRGVWILGPYTAEWIPEERIWLVTRTSNKSWETTKPNIQEVLDWYEEVK